MKPIAVGLSVSRQRSVAGINDAIVLIRPTAAPTTAAPAATTLPTDGADPAAEIAAEAPPTLLETFALRLVVIWIYRALRSAGCGSQEPFVHEFELLHGDPGRHRVQVRTGPL